MKVMAVILACALLSGTASTTYIPNAWQLERGMNTPRIGHASVTHAGKVYAFWGSDEAGSGISEIKTIEVFDGMGWTEYESCPGRGVSNAKAVTLGGYIYLIGGYIPHKGSSNKVWRYTPSTDTWERCEDMPGERVTPGVVALGGKIYVIGGASWPGWTYHDTVYIYDPTKDYLGSSESAWSIGWFHPGRGNGYPLGICQAVGVGGKIFILGGYTGTPEFGNVSDEIWRYDPDAEFSYEAWSLEGYMPDGRASHAVELLYGYVFIMGGHEPWDGSGYPPSSTFWVFDPNNHMTITRMLSTPLPWTGIGSGVIDGRLFCFGGDQDGLYGDPGHRGCWSWRRD